jgi:hypothetical protein
MPVVCAPEMADVATTPTRSWWRRRRALAHKLPLSPTARRSTSPGGVAEGGREIVELPRLTVMEHCCATA